MARSPGLWRDGGHAETRRGVGLDGDGHGQHGLVGGGGVAVGIRDGQGQGDGGGGGGRGAAQGAGVTVEGQAGRDGGKGVAEGAVAADGFRQDQRGDGAALGPDARRHDDRAETRRALGDDGQGDGQGVGVGVGVHGDPGQGDGAGEGGYATQGAGDGVQDEGQGNGGAGGQGVEGGPVAVHGFRQGQHGDGDAGDVGARGDGRRAEVGDDVGVVVGDGQDDAATGEAVVGTGAAGGMGDGEGVGRGVVVMAGGDGDGDRREPVGGGEGEGAGEGDGGTGGGGAGGDRYGAGGGRIQPHRVGLRVVFGHGEGGGVHADAGNVGRDAQREAVVETGKGEALRCSDIRLIGGLADVREDRVAEYDGGRRGHAEVCAGTRALRDGDRGGGV